MPLRAICQLISTAEEALTISSNGSGKQRSTWASLKVQLIKKVGLTNKKAWLAFPYIPELLPINVDCTYPWW